MAAIQCEDALAERKARLIWVHGAAPQPYPQLRAQFGRTRAERGRAPAEAPLRLTYDVATEAEAQRERAERQRALAQARQPPPRRDVYVKGAMEWEKNAWKVWDKKKVQEEERRDRYGTALTTYIGGQKIVTREEPAALGWCAHCDIGGGIHPLRRCMGCMAVAYCCRAHQKVHWQWHKHICFAVRAANNLEARKGAGAGWVKLRPRRWRKPRIEKGAIVETNCRLRFANWKQFYTNGAQSMLNVMGDGGPLVCAEWDEAVASMAICEEATIVFSVGACSRMMLPFVGARKAPPGTIIVAEIGLIDVRRDGGRRREVNEFMSAKFIEEKKQKKLDALEDSKLMRLRDRRDTLEHNDTVQRLLTASTTSKAAALGFQKDSVHHDANGAAAADGRDLTLRDDKDSAAAAAPPATATDAAATDAAMVGTEEDDDDKEVWEEEPEIDFEGFDDDGGDGDGDGGGGGDGGVAACAGWLKERAEAEAAPPLNASSTATDADAAIATPSSGPLSVPGNPWGDTAGAQVEANPPPPLRPDDPWASVDAVAVDDVRAIDAAKRVASSPAAAPAPAPAPTPARAPAPVPSREIGTILAKLGLEHTAVNFERKGLTTARLRAQAEEEPQALQRLLGELGLKMGQRQKLINALLQ